MPLLQNGYDKCAKESGECVYKTQEQQEQETRRRQLDRPNVPIAQGKKERS